MSLKAILESPNIPKVVFDIRNDSYALFSRYQIRFDGIKDLQLMKLATRQGSKTLLASRLYDPKNGGQYEIFNERPMRPEIKKYCIGEVVLLPGLYDVYNAKLRPRNGDGAFWRVQVREETEKRIELSQRPDYNGQAKNKISGPWKKWEIEEAMDEWNEEVLFNIMTDDLVLNKDDRWV